MNKSTRTMALGATMLLASLGGAAVTASASAQTRAALVQDTDEPGRNPYQSSLLKFCVGQNSCAMQFAAVPAGMRLVVTHISGAVLVSNGFIPSGVLALAGTGTPNSPTIYFTGVRGAAGAGGTLFAFGQECLAYFEAGAIPSVALDFFPAPDTFAGGAAFTLTGYFVKLP